MTSRASRTLKHGLFLAVLGGTAHALLRPAVAQEAEVLKSRVLTATRLATLSGSTIKPYHLDASLTIYDGAGKNPQSGTLKIIRDEHGFKLTIAFTDAESSYLATSADKFTSSHGNLPYYAPRIVRVVQTPLSFQGFGAEQPVRPKDLPSTLAVDCIALVPGTEAVVRGPEVPVHEVCLDSKNDDLLVVVDDKLEYFREDLFSFDGQRIAKKVKLRVGGILVGEVEIQQLENSAADASEFVPSTDMKPLGSLCAGGRFDNVGERLESAASFVSIPQCLAWFAGGLC